MINEPIAAPQYIPPHSGRGAAREEMLPLGYGGETQVSDAELA
jgi:hypothetical protein